MSKLIFLFLILATSAAGANPSSILFKCQVKSAKYNIKFELDAVGFSEFLISKSSKSHKICKPRLQEFIWNERAHIPYFELQFNVQPCNLSGILKSSEMQTIYAMVVTLTDSTHPTAQLQWQNSQSPDNCVIEKINSDELRRKQKNWKEKRWGH